MQTHRNAERNRRFVFFLCISAFLYLCLLKPAAASPQDVQEEDQDQSQAQTETLSEKADKLKSELADLQQELVSVAKAEQQSEAKLSSEEENLRILDAQLEDRNTQLKAERGKLAALVQAALKLSRTPPEAVVMMPGATLETMTAARALKLTAQSIHQQMNSIGLQLAELDRLKTKVEKRKTALEKRRRTLETSQHTLTRRIAARQALWDKVGHQQAAAAEKTAATARKAENLHGLFSSLLGGKSKEAVRGHLRPFFDAMGHIRPPAAGKIVQLFGHERSQNETNRGIVIATRDDAPVTAPYDGEVVFTGPFRGYGKLVILRHADGFHTLLSGLKTINVNVGEFLLEGEPIGAMGESPPSTRLYVELRKNNQPVDPAPWMGIR